MNDIKRPSVSAGENLNPNNYRLWVVIGIVALNSIGMSKVLPLLPFLVARYFAQIQVAFGMGALLSVFAACTFFVALILGTLNDRFGRKLILIISIVGSTIG